MGPAVANAINRLIPFRSGQDSIVIYFASLTSMSIEIAQTGFIIVCAILYQLHLVSDYVILVKAELEMVL